MKADKYHLLVVDDEPVTLNNFIDYFEVAGFFVTALEDGRLVNESLANNEIDLVLLDINLPGEDGLSIARELRRTSDIGIILVTGRTDDIDRIVGIEIGADDYVTKPVNPRELLARIKSILWRMSKDRPETTTPSGNSTETIKVFSNWCLDMEKQQLRSQNGTPVSLTGAEYNILMYFTDHPGLILNRDQLINQIDEAKDENFSSRTVDVLIGRLRKKLETDKSEATLIDTVWGKGYRFTSQVKIT
ncbi:MAG: two-component system torCAD operon response regulator TorR [Paraglaciecola sp.]|jgi:two-component system torCAD operon response regulator TorR